VKLNTLNVMKNKLLNPFRYMPIRQATCWGLVALILSAVLCWQAGLRITSLTQINFAGDALWVATARQVIVWVLFSLVLYAAGVIFSKSKVRFQDVAAFNLFARIPFDISLLIFLFPQVRSVMGLLMDNSLNTALQYMNLLTIVGLVSSVLCVWYMVWSYMAFSEATNLKGGRGVAIFAVAWIISYLGSPFLLMWA
jgi:hypothetical protein